MYRVISRRRLVVDEGVSRILHHHASPARRGLIRASAGTAAAFLALAVAACGSASSQTPSTVSLGSAAQRDCTSVADVLADGPDPGADPVGYAEAQVLPLRRLTINDATLHHAVLTLASAYATFSASGTSTRASSARAVTTAENEVNKICPQAAQ
jgi:hypothetical protein